MKILLRTIRKRPVMAMNAHRKGNLIWIKGIEPKIVKVKTTEKYRISLLLKLAFMNLKTSLNVF